VFGFDMLNGLLVFCCRVSATPAEAEAEDDDLRPVGNMKRRSSQACDCEGRRGAVVEASGVASGVGGGEPEEDCELERPLGL
jgi:hypothetical protein